MEIVMDIIQNAKELAALIKKLGNIELERRTLSLQSEILELTSELVELKKENAEMKQLLEREKQLTFKPPLYYAEGDPTPFCPICWEQHRKTIHVIGPKTVESTGHVYAHCNICNKDFVIVQGRSISHTINKRYQGLH
jgi:formate dehydrogenase maturation protein FdhE